MVVLVRAGFSLGWPRAVKINNNKDNNNNNDDNNNDNNGRSNNNGKVWRD